MLRARYRLCIAGEQGRLAFLLVLMYAERPYNLLLPLTAFWRIIETFHTLLIKSSLRKVIS